MSETRQTFYNKDTRFGVITQPTDEGQPGKMTLVGYAMIWNAVSSDRGGYCVRLLPGSVNFTPTVFALFHHEFKEVIGNTDNATLRIEQDDIGVKVEIDLPNNTVGMNVFVWVRDKYVNGMSFSMVSGPETSQTVTENDIQIVNVKRFTCDEITVTPIPAFTQTSIAVMSDDSESIDATDPIIEQNPDNTEELRQLSQKLDEYRLHFYNLSGQSIRESK
jgi:HK97 family phage prohead protease